MAKLVIRGPDGEREVVLRDHTTIGRRPDCDIAIIDHLVSGRHVYLVYDAGVWRLRDLGSSNGTFVNHKRVEQVELTQGDVLQLGSTVIEFHEGDGMESAVGAVRLDDEAASLVHTRVDGQDLERFVPVEQISDIEQIKRDYEKLRVASELNQAIGLEADIDVLLEKILLESFKLLAADRGVILLMNPVTNKLEPRSVKHRKGEGEEIVLSSTVISEVFGTGAGVLTSDATLDSRFSAAKSVMATGMRSTMCVPMIYRSQIFGIIHLDCLSARGAFSKKDLQILSGVAAQAARAIDNAYKAKEIEKNALARRDFERLLPSEIVDQVVSGKVQLQRGGELREAAVLFSDIRGFTRWTESHEPTHIVSILNDYFELMVDAIHRHKGTLDKFMGDGIMALFGAPIAHEDDTLNAVMCALDMLDGLHRLNQRLQASGLEPVEIGIGINSGPVIAGYMGSSKSMEYTAIGDHVNLSARLCGIAEPGQILLSENTFRAVSESVAAKPLPPVQVKGKRDPISIYQVLSRRNTGVIQAQDTAAWAKTPAPELKDP